MAGEKQEKRFYIVPVDQEDLIFELSATTDATVSYDSKVTSFPVQDGSDSTDNVVLDPVMISISGIITDVSQSAALLSFSRFLETDDQKTKVKNYISELEVQLNKKQLFTVVLPTINKVETCIVTSFTITKNNKLAGDAWLVSLNLQKVRQAIATTVVSASAEPFLQIKETAAGNVAELDPDKTEDACDSSLTAGLEICKKELIPGTGKVKVFFNNGKTAII